MEDQNKRGPGRPPGSKNKPKAKTAKMPQQWNGGRCVCCGKIFNQRVNNFSKSRSYWFHGNNGFLPWCKECMGKMFEYYLKKYNGDNRAALERMAMMFDLYYCEDLVEYSDRMTKGGINNLINMYMGRVNMHQYEGKTYDDVIDNYKRESISNGEAPEKSKVTSKMIKFWGPNLDESDYLYLDEHYKNLTARLECKTVTQEILFKRIAKAELNCEKAELTGDTKKIKEANDNLQNLMGSANIKPNQTNDNSLAETNTFGTLIQKWEETEPISDPDPEWADVDGIGKFFRVWVLGTILNMFGLKNPYKEEYDIEMERYTAHKPEYEDDSDSVETIRDKIFGPEST